MKYLLDTNACINHLRSPGNVGIGRKLADANPSDVVLCSVVKAELIYGALRSRETAKNLAYLERFSVQFTSLPFDDLAAGAYGQIRYELANRGTPIGPNDLMIAAIAIVNNLTLVTHNTGEFERVPDLKMQDWEGES